MKQNRKKRWWRGAAFIFGPGACRLVVLCLTLSGPCVEAVRGSSPDITCKAPVTVAPNPAGAPGSDAAAKGTGKLLVEPSELDIKVFAASDTASFSVLNETSGTIDTLYFSSLGLQDGKTNQRVPAWTWAPSTLNPPLKVNERTDCTFTIPANDHAGAFSGSLHVDGGGYEASVPLTIRVRGPYLQYWKELPLAFLTAVFLLGWGVSVALDNWYTTSLPRVQQVVLLRDAQIALSNFLASVAAWEKKHSVTLTKTDATAAFDKSALDTLLVNVNTTSLTNLQQAAQRFALACALDDELYTALQIAEAKIPGGSLPQAAQQLDGIAQGQDPAAYRATLLQVLTAAPSAAAIPPAAVPPFGAGINLSTASAASLHRRMALMDYVKFAVTAVVVWITAYTVYYLPNPSFGTALDYLSLSLWSLGLTATGSQLLSGIRRS